jgi:hypothetical protein
MCIVDRVSDVAFRGDKNELGKGLSSFFIVLPQLSKTKTTCLALCFNCAVKAMELLIANLRSYLKSKLYMH